MTVLTSGMAMAAYACPQLTPMSSEEVVMDGMPCAEMDKEKPVHCAEFQSGAQLALEHLATTPALTPVFSAFVIPAPALPVPIALSAVQGDVCDKAGADPPYLRTLRLRI